MEVEQTREPAAEHSQESQQFLTFLLAGEEYGVDILRVREIRGWEGATVVPNMPVYLKGIINLRGAIVPVIDLRERFSLPYGEYGPTTVVIVLQVQQDDINRTMGIVVDAVSDVHDVPLSSFRQAPDLGCAIDMSFVRNLATVGEKMIIVLDIDRLLSSGELGARGLD